MLDAPACSNRIDCRIESSCGAGVWTDTGKIAATGIRATRWISYHGIALNITVDLSPFRDIIPCGINGRAVSSVCAHLESCGTSLLASRDHDVHDDALLAEYRTAIVEAFEDEFKMRASHTKYALQ